MIDIFAPGTCSRRCSGASSTRSRSIDDDRSRWGSRVAGVPVVGGTQQLEGLFAKGYFDTAVCSIGTSVSARTRFRELCEDLGIPLTNAIDPTARICADVTLGTGNVICAFAISASARASAITTCCPPTTPSIITTCSGSDITTGPGCMTSGLVRIGDRVRLGTGILVEPHLEIGEDAQVASGAVIINSVPPAHAVKRRVATMTTVPIRGGRKARLGHRPPTRRS